MVDQELLAAISDLLEEKLEEKLEVKLQPIRQDIAELKTEVSELKADNRSLHVRMDSLEKEVRRNSIILENEVLPRLQTIEQCYVESSRIFIQKSEQIDKMQDDIDVMKVVIQEHSHRMEKIS